MDFLGVGESLLECTSSQTDEIIHPSDRYGQTISNRYTSSRVSHALSAYIACTGHARAVTKTALREVCASLLKNSLAIVQASHVALLLQVAVMHATAAKQKGWTLPILDTRPEAKLSLEYMCPYWMGAGARTVPNNVELDGIFLLTAPNMSGECLSYSCRVLIGV